MVLLPDNWCFWTLPSLAHCPATEAAIFTEPGMPSGMDQSFSSRRSGIITLLQGCASVFYNRCRPNTGGLLYKFALYTLCDIIEVLSRFCVFCFAEGNLVLNIHSSLLGEFPVRTDLGPHIPGEVIVQKVSRHTRIPANVFTLYSRWTHFSPASIQLELWCLCMHLTHFWSEVLLVYVSLDTVIMSQQGIGSFEKWYGPAKSRDSRVQWSTHMQGAPTKGSEGMHPIGNFGFLQFFLVHSHSVLIDFTRWLYTLSSSSTTAGCHTLELSLHQWLSCCFKLVLFLILDSYHS